MHDNPVSQRIARNINYYLSLEGMTLAGLARKSGIHVQTLYKFMSAKNDLTLGKVAQIADGFHISVDAMLNKTINLTFEDSLRHDIVNRRIQRPNSLRDKADRVEMGDADNLTTCVHLAMLDGLPRSEGKALKHDDEDTA